MRDSQRGKVYKSDHALDTYGRLETVPEIEAFVAKLWKSERFKKRFPREIGCSPPSVRDGRGRRRASGGRCQIRMPRWSRTKGIICHELAHTVHIRSGKGQPWCAAHGWEFCLIYLQIVYILMGWDAHDALKAAFKANRVKYRQPIKRRPLSPEQRAANIARLSVYNGTAATE